MGRKRLNTYYVNPFIFKRELWLRGYTMKTICEQLGYKPYKLYNSMQKGRITDLLAKQIGAYLCTPLDKLGIATDILESEESIGGYLSSWLEEHPDISFKVSVLKDKKYLIIFATNNKNFVKKVYSIDDLRNKKDSYLLSIFYMAADELRKENDNARN